MEITSKIKELYPEKSELELADMLGHSHLGIINGKCFDKSKWLRDTLIVTPEMEMFITKQAKAFNYITSKTELDQVDLIRWLQGDMAEEGFYLVEDIISSQEVLEEKYGYKCWMPTLAAEEILADIEDDNGNRIIEKVYLPDYYYQVVIVNENHDYWNKLPMADRDGIMYAFSQELENMQKPVLEEAY